MSQELHNELFKMVISIKATVNGIYSMCQRLQKELKELKENDA